MILKQKVEERRRYLIHQLWKHGYDQTPDGIKTEDLSLGDLEQIHINVKCRIAREMSKREST
jgi:hypothetical protein